MFGYPIFAPRELTQAIAPRRADYGMDLANWMPREAYCAQYHMGGRAAVGVYSYPTLPFSHPHLAVTFLQSMGPPFLSEG